MKKVISLLLSVAMVLSLTAVEVMADDVETVTDDTETVADDVKVMTVDAEDAEKKENAVTLDLSQGSIVISATGYKQGGGDETPFTGAYTIKQSDKAYLTNTVSVTVGTHEITMNDVVIDASGISGACAFSIATGATVDLKLAGRVMLKSGEYAAGLSVPAGAAVTISAISASGALTAAGGKNSAGIGGSASGNVVYASGGNITILSGTVDALGGENAAGIGGASDGAGTGKGESICISGGKVTATGGSDGAGIGGGRSSYGAGTGQNGKITIEGNAIVTATGGSHGAGIGGGYGANGTGEGGKITLGGAANVTASSVYGAGIGSGETKSDSVYGTGQSGEVLITENVTVKASSRSGAGIGGGVPANYGSYGTGKDGRLTINGNADVTAISMYASGIGGGWSNNRYSDSHTTGINGVISISGNAVVKATGGAYGIGGYDYNDMNGSLNIAGGTVTAHATSTDSTYACGIGRISKCNIYGGTVSASGYTGIYRANVNGGVVTAESSKRTNGFGTLTADGNWYGWVTSLPAQASNGMKSGVLFSGNEGKIIGSSYTLPADREIPEGATLTVDAGQELIVPAGTTLTVNGKLVVAGTLNTAETGVIAGSGETEITGTVTGKKLPIAIQAQNMSTMEKTFDVSTLFTIPQTAGAAAYTVTKDETPVELDGTTLSIPDGGVFTVTVTTEGTANYQAASATATLTATVHNHQLRAVAAKAPDCLNAGNIAYWVCESGCGKYFSDESGENVITAAKTVLPATGHHFDNGVCTACGAEDPAYEAGAVIEAGSLTTYPGDTIKVPISVRNNPGISSIKLTVTYDPAVLGYKGCTFNEALTSIAGSQTVVNDTQSGRVVLSWVVANAAYTDAKGDIAVLDFEVKSVAENTSSPVSISYEPESTFDNNLVDQKFLIKNGTVQVNMIRLGDINGDRTVDINDALLLLNYVCDLRKDEVKGNPDVNGDGAVNNKDVVILLRYIAKFEGITLH